MMMQLMMMGGDLMIRRIVPDMERDVNTVYLYFGLLEELDILRVCSALPRINR
jgi:hypothetical protein